MCVHCMVLNSTDDYACITYLNLGKPVMIVTEYMENGSLDSFLRVSIYFTCIYISPPYLYLLQTYINME